MKNEESSLKIVRHGCHVCLLLGEGKHLLSVGPGGVHGVQLAAAQVVHDARPDGVADDVDGGAAAVEEPVHGEDDGDVVRREPHRLQHHHHRHQSRLGDARSPDTRRRGRDGDRADLPQRQVQAVHLGVDTLQTPQHTQLSNASPGR